MYDCKSPYTNMAEVPVHHESLALLVCTETIIALQAYFLVSRDGVLGSQVVNLNSDRGNCQTNFALSTTNMQLVCTMYRTM